MNQPVEIANYLPIDFETFADAPYSFICPDGPTFEEQDALSKGIYDALAMALDHQDTTNRLGVDRSELRAIGFSFRLAQLGLAVLRVAESRGLTYMNGEIVQESDA